MARIVAIEMKRVQIKAEYNQLFEMKPVKKSGNAPWVRVASSAQSWWEDPTFPICAFPPRLRAGSDAYPGRANYSVDFNGLLFAQPSFNVSIRRDGYWRFAIFPLRIIRDEVVTPHKLSASTTRQ